MKMKRLKKMGISNSESFDILACKLKVCGSEDGHCPHCGVCFKGDPIPEKHRESYYRGAKFYSKLIRVKTLRQNKDRNKCFQCLFEWEV